MLWILYSQHIYVHEPLHFQTLWVHYNMLGLGHCYVFKSKTCCETETTNTKVISTSKWSETIFVSVNIELKSFNLLFKLRVLMYTYSCRNNLREIYILIKASLLSFLIPPNFVNLWSFSFRWEWHYWKYNFFIRGFELGLYPLGIQVCELQVLHWLRVSQMKIIYIRDKTYLPNALRFWVKMWYQCFTRGVTLPMLCTTKWTSMALTKI